MTRETFKTVEEIKEAMQQWGKATLCRMGASCYVLLEVEGPIGIARVKRMKISEDLFRKASRFLELT